MQRKTRVFIAGNLISLAFWLAVVNDPNVSMEARRLAEHMISQAVDNLLTLFRS